VNISEQSAHPASTLLIARGAEQSLGYILQPRIGSPSARCKVVHHQECIFGIKRQPLQGIAGRSKVRRQTASIHDGAEMLLAQSRQSTLEHAGLTCEAFSRQRYAALGLALKMLRVSRRCLLEEN
jgi:hypothetical protein